MRSVFHLFRQKLRAMATTADSISNLPDGSDLIYLDHAGTPYAIAPARKQYAELTPTATGFQLHKLMTPGQLVSYLDRLQGIELVGEETVNGRPHKSIVTHVHQIRTRQPVKSIPSRLSTSIRKPDCRFAQNFTAKQVVTCRV